MNRKHLAGAALLCAVGTLSAALVAGALSGASARESHLPTSFADVRATWCPSDVRVLDRRGAVLHETRTDPGARRLAWTPLEQISPSFVRAVVESEDKRFRWHAGVDWRAVAAAIRDRMAGRGRRGASTITMQLAALVDPSLARRGNGRSVSDKWRQMRAAWAIERAWTKDEILEAYLNLVPLRGEVEGVGAAAHAIFAKAPHGLDAAESSALAASIRAPNASADELLERAERLAAALGANQLSLGADLSPLGAVSPALGADLPSVGDAVRRVVAAPDLSGPRASLAPHLARKLVAAAPPCRDVESTLDARVQAFAVESLHRGLTDLEGRFASDGALVVADNESGEILAYVGSARSLSMSPEVDGVRARRQAGSTLKPFLYALAIERGLVTPATLLDDSPLELPVDGNLYRPANYDGNFRGLVSVRTALAASLNIPAVRMLELAGEDSFVDTLRRLGFDGMTETGSWYGPSLALGSADVSLWELVGAYRALANRGAWNPLRVDRGSPGPSRPVFDEASAWLTGDILADRESRATTFHLENLLATRFWTAVKTGTSKDMRDNWCVGWSSRYTVGVWIGNFSGAPMHDVSGTAGAAPVWNDVMTFLHADVPSDPPARPAGVVEASTEFSRGAEPPRRERYRRGSEPRPGSEPLDEWPRIAEPVDGSRFAIDPDIPDERQRIPLVAHAPTATSVWRLDGRELGRAIEPVSWKPARGQHELVLADGASTFGVVRFQVKGSEKE